MSALRAIATGLQRALGSPVILLWLWLLGLIVAVPAAWIVADSIEQDIGSSRAHESMRDGFDMEWYSSFEREADGLAGTFTPTHIGLGAFLDNLESWAEGKMFDAPLGASLIGGLYALLRLWMLGGVLDRYADREARPGLRRFFGSGSRLFFRFLRLALISAGLYAAVFWSLNVTLKWIGRTTRDVTVEATIIMYVLFAIGTAALLLTVIHACFGFAKVATVVDERRSMLLAAVQGVVFVFKHPTRVAGLYAGFMLISGLMLGGYALLAPGVGQSSWRAVGWALAWSQLFLILKMYVRLSLLAGQTALYQASRVSDATPARPPTPDVWPEQESLPLSDESAD